MAERFRLPYRNALVSVCVEFCDFIAFNFPGGKYKSVSCNASELGEISEIRVSWKMEDGSRKIFVCEELEEFNINSRR